MSIPIEIGDIVGFKVKGTYNDEAGVAQPFDFSLTCDRLDVDEIKAKIKDESDKSFEEFMISIIKGWSGVRTVDKKPEPYTPDAYARLCKIPGIAALAFHTYFAEVGAKEKN